MHLQRFKTPPRTKKISIQDKLFGKNKMNNINSNNGNNNTNPKWNFITKSETRITTNKSSIKANVVIVNKISLFTKGNKKCMCSKFWRNMARDSKAPKYILKLPNKKEC